MSGSEMQEDVHEGGGYPNIRSLLLVSIQILITLQAPGVGIPKGEKGI